MLDWEVQVALLECGCSGRCLWMALFSLIIYIFTYMYILARSSPCRSYVYL